MSLQLVVLIKQLKHGNVDRYYDMILRSRMIWLYMIYDTHLLLKINNIFNIILARVLLRRIKNIRTFVFTKVQNTYISVLSFF